MKFIFLTLIFGLISCIRQEEAKQNVIQRDDYALVEFAAKLEEAEAAGNK